MTGIIHPTIGSGNEQRTIRSAALGQTINGGTQ
jgi:hypothetical protein